MCVPPLTPKKAYEMIYNVCVFNPDHYAGLVMQEAGLGDKLDDDETKLINQKLVFYCTDDPHTYDGHCHFQGAMIEPLTAEDKEHYLEYLHSWKEEYPVPTQFITNANVERLQKVLDTVTSDPTLMTNETKALIEKLYQLTNSNQSSQAQPYTGQKQQTQQNPYPLATQMLEEIKKSQSFFAEELKQLEEIIEPETWSKYKQNLNLKSLANAIYNKAILSADSNALKNIFSNATDKWTLQTFDKATWLFNTKKTRQLIDFQFRVIGIDLWLQNKNTADATQSTVPSQLIIFDSKNEKFALDFKMILETEKNAFAELLCNFFCENIEDVQAEHCSNVVQMINLFRENRSANNVKQSWRLIFWLLFAAAVDDEIYNEELSKIIEVAYLLDFDEPMIRDWCNAVKYIASGNKFDKDCDLKFETQQGKDFFE